MSLLNSHKQNVLPGLFAVCIFTVGAAAGCQDSTAKSKSHQATRASAFNSPEFGKQIEDAELSVLFIGNSHSVEIPGLLRSISAENAPARNVLFSLAPGSGFLITQARQKRILNAIDAGPWDYVVLQGQKYSTTGKYHYPYDGAIELSKRVTSNGSKVIMYPEWSSRGKPDEYLRINKIHHEIAEQTGATVAPIGEAWKRASDRIDDLELHSSDGNHANADGKYLTACVFYSLLTGESLVSEISDGSDLKDRLAAIAWEVVSEMEAKTETPSTQEPPE